MAGYRGLVVEDELAVALCLEDMLLDAGSTVLGPVGRLDQAMALARGDGFGFALLDVNLRGVPVFPVAELLAERGVPFAFLTGYGRQDLPARFANVPILSKPFQSAELVGLVAQLLAPAC